MNDRVTILTRTYASELAVIQSMLETEGIETFLKDELTVQANPLYSNAIGGVKLQVREEDVPRTIEILREAGFLEEEKPTVLWQWFDKFSTQIPLVNRVQLELRLLILGAVLVAAAMGVYYLTTLSSVYEALTERKWCVDYLVYNQQKYAPNSLGLRFEIPGMNFCNEQLDFMSNGRVIFPGLNTAPVYGSWSFENDRVIVTHTDTFKQIFGGKYEVDMSYDKLVLESPITTIYCYRIFN